MQSRPLMSSAVEYERAFGLFGSRVRLLIGEPLRAGIPSPEAMAVQMEFFLRLLERRLTRFDPESDLSRMNADRGDRCEVSTTLAVAVDAAVWAARRSGGLVDPTLLAELERAGYRRSRVGIPPADIREAVAAAPRRSPARAAASSRWRAVAVDAVAGVVVRPTGIRIDSGGIGKGLSADLVAERLAGYSTFVIDAGGDLRLGGERPLPRQVRIDHPFRDDPAHEFRLDVGAVATSGLKTRIWRTETGFAHHLLDPSTGEPAWTGVIQATSLGATALEAETLAKTALLRGPAGAREVLEPHGGLIVLDDGTVELCGSLAARSVPPVEAVTAA